MPPSHIVCQALSFARAPGSLFILIQRQLALLQNSLQQGGSEETDSNNKEENQQEPIGQQHLSPRRPRLPALCVDHWHFHRRGTSFSA
jgi:hypothetical protein